MSSGPSSDAAGQAPAAGDTGDVHIVGALVHARPAWLAQVQAAIAALEGAEVFRSGDDGKIVVVIEAPSAAAVLRTIDAIRTFDGVLNVALVYQHSEPAASLQQEIEP